MSAEGDIEVGRRSSSPPGKESREDWKGGERNTENLSIPALSSTPTSKPDEPKSSRSRSPRSNSPDYKGKRLDRESRYQRDGTNTNSREPHLQRARLFVGNIEPNNTHRKDIIELFSRHGEVLGVSVHKGYAFIQMDRERSANRAVNAEDNRNFMGSRIHVEFSQAALKAGAKFERIPTREPPTREPPAQEILRSQPTSRAIHSSLTILEIEREREERLSRILSMERELALLRSREETAATRRPPPTSDVTYDRYEAYRRDRSPVRRGEPEYPPQQRDYPPQRDYPSQREYTRSNDRLAFEGARGGDDDRGRSYYNGRSETSSIREGVVGGMSARLGPSVSGEAYRNPVSYPIQGRGGYNQRDTLQYGSGGGQGGGTSGYAPRGGVGFGQSVGYGSSGGKVGMGGGAPPPGWPSTDYDKSNANRPPFAWN